MFGLLVLNFSLEKIHLIMHLAELEGHVHRGTQENKDARKKEGTEE